MFIEIDLKNAANQHVLYHLVTAANEIVHIGIVPFNQLTMFNDVPNEIKDEVVYLSVIRIDEDRLKLGNDGLDTDNYMLRERLLKTVESWSKKSNKQMVECIETGEMFSSAAETARAHNLTYGALINHLAGKKCYKTVKGKTYRKVSQ